MQSWNLEVVFSSSFLLTLDLNEFINNLADALRISELVTPLPLPIREKVQNDLNKCISEKPKDRNIMLVYAFFLIKANNLPFAVDFLAKCIKEHPEVFKRHTHIHFKAVEFYYYRASMLGFLRRWEESIPMFDMMIKLKPNEPEMYYLRGSALKNISSKVKESLQDLHTFVKLAHPHERKIPSGKIYSYMAK